MPTDTDLGPLVRQQIEEILSDPGARAALGLGLDAGTRNRLDTLEGQLGGLLQDRSLQAASGSALWLNGASVVNGTVTADKLVVNTLESVTTNTGTLNVTGTITAAAAFPATGARIAINSSGLYGFQADGVTSTFKLNVDGSGEIGSGANKITWTNTGLVTVPAAVIGSLTIANVGSGMLGGTYQTSGATTRLEFSPSSFRALASGVETFVLNATTGAMTATGSFTIRSATTGARVVLDNAGGIEGFNAGGTSMFRFNAATGAGYVGGTGAGLNGISWDSSGTVSIGGSTFSAGKIVAGSLSISTLSAISANMGTITAGTISAGTVSASTLTTGSLVFGSTGTVNTTGAVSGTFGGLNIANLTVTGTLTLGAGGKIVDADGSEWSQTGIILKSGGAFGDTIKWQNAGVDKGSIVASSTDLQVIGTSSGSSLLLASGTANLTVSSFNGIYLGSAGVQSAGKLYPGYGAAGGLNSTYYIDAGTGGIITNGIGIGGMLGISSGNTINFISPGTGGSASNWSSFTTLNIPDKSAGYFLIQIAGTNYRVPIYANG